MLAASHFDTFNDKQSSPPRAAQPYELVVVLSELGQTVGWVGCPLSWMNTALLVGVGQGQGMDKSR